MKKNIQEIIFLENASKAANAQFMKCMLKRKTKGIAGKKYREIKRKRVTREGVREKNSEKYREKEKQSERDRHQRKENNSVGERENEG